MPTYEVTAPDGQTYEITAPEGASEAQVMAYAKSQFAKQQPKPGRLETFVRGVYQPVTNVSGRIATGINALLGTNLQGDIQADKENDAALSASQYQGARLAGNVVGTLPTLAIPGGPLAQGAAGGAALSEADTLGGLAFDTAAGAIASKVGDKAVGAVQRAIAPKLAPGVQTLVQEGVRMTPGQAARATGTKAGEMLGKAEDKLMSLPFTGGIIEAGRKRAAEDFNRALLSRPLKVLGETMPKNAPVGHEGIKAVGDFVSRVYDKTLRDLSGQADEPFKKAVATIPTKAKLPAAEAQELADTLSRELAPLMSGKFTGKALGKVRDRLDKLAAAAGKDAQNVYRRDMGEAIGQARAAVMALAKRQNPRAAGSLAKADKAWAELVRIERAALNTADGVITPQGYQQAIRNVDRSVRRRAVSRGQAMGQDFAKAASEALPSKVPNSGTFDRMAANSLYTMLGAGLAPVAGAAQASVPLVTRQAGAGAQRAANALTPLRRGAQLAGPALLLNPDE